MSDLRWSDIEELLPVVNQKDYRYNDTNKSHNDAVSKIRRAFLAMEAKADERDALRQLLMASGIENAQLCIAIEQAQIREAAANERAAIRDLTPTPASEAAEDQETKA